MADKKEKMDKKKGVVGKYNQKSVTKRDYYYDYNDVSKEEKGFSDAFSDLNSFNKKLTSELKKEKTVKLKVDKKEEKVVENIEWLSDGFKANREFYDYKLNEGKEDMKGFIKLAIKAVKEGKKIKRGRDLV